MGLPVSMWCQENLNKIAKLWGKLVKHDDRSDEWKSYSTARILIYCFQWEQVHEWVSIRIEDRPPTRRGGQNLKFLNIGDPLLGAIIEDRTLITVSTIKGWSDNGGTEVEEARREINHTMD
ncbi:hypothetical protein PIB30_085400 [Stylosanthes scabra]|uniref:Uncharacterized protein n=1 Tax=Stylosanthes scabra TaxID=79078 RepID=A0ABU6SUI6_9FABA|nr:hypothetical protein [Stylosanthes scabra]